eukprot:8256865-Pyramimonas_sp.AAC.1
MDSIISRSAKSRRPVAVYRRRLTSDEKETLRSPDGIDCSSDEIIHIRLDADREYGQTALGQSSLVLEYTHVTTHDTPSRAVREPLVYHVLLHPAYTTPPLA